MNMGAFNLFRFPFVDVVVYGQRHDGACGRFVLATFRACDEDAARDFARECGGLIAMSWGAWERSQEAV